MKRNEFVSIDNIINAKEYNRIAGILKEYSIEPIKIEKVRSVYKITTNGRIYCLKKTEHGGESKIEKGMQLSRYLVSKGFYNVIRYIKTSDNKVCVKSGHSIYYLTDWIKGRESDFGNFEELKNCITLLAEFHDKSSGFTIEASKITDNTRKWPAILKKQKNELIEISEIIKLKKVKTSFDVIYFEQINEYIEKMNLSIKLLDESRYLDLSYKAHINKSVCHDSFYYQNILVKNNNKIYLIDLDSSLYDLNVCDLAKLIRRVMYRKKYGWKFENAKELIETYSKINPLSKEELELLLAFIIFPHKYWKLGRKRYKSRKAWSETKYLKKLNKVIRYKDLEKSFIDDYYQYFLNKDIKKE